MATALDPEGGPASANVALRVLDAIDPLVDAATEDDGAERSRRVADPDSHCREREACDREAESQRHLSPEARRGR